MRGCLDQRCDARAEQEDLAVLDHRVAFADVGATGADSLQFPALQGQAGLVAGFEVVLVLGTLGQRDGGIL